ncbi:MAG: hypothetical protein IH946_00730 [Bacteroidetes bacterium]|nr:hypothetical protein [Bacteroidota bacterium]
MFRLIYIWLLLIPFLFSCKKKLDGFTVEQLDPGTDDNLRAVYFIDVDTGYVAGGLRYSQGTLLKTTNGGNDWKRTSILNKIIFDLHFIDSQNGYAACLDGKILRTNDHGVDWDISQSPEWKPMHDIDFIDSIHGYAVGGVGYNDGVIMRTEDGGVSWESQRVNKELRTVHFLDQNTGFAAGFGLLIKTQNGGLSWDTTTVDGDHFKELVFPDKNTGYLIGGNGTIYKTTDGGDNWDRIRNGNNPFQVYFFQSAWFSSIKDGFVIGDKGLMLRTIDGGKNWLRVKKFTNEDLQDIWMVDDKNGFVCGENGTLFRFSLE